MIHSIRYSLIVIACLLMHVAIAGEAPQPLHGTVYLDSNSNGVRDAGEGGVAGVGVSNGVAIARTDALGHYTLKVDAGQTVFVIKPSGYAFPRGANGLPVFWRNNVPNGSPPLKDGGIAPTGALPEHLDFALLPSPMIRNDKPLDVLVFGDPQPKDLVDVGYYQRDIVDPILAKAHGHQPAQLGLSLGDEVSDDQTLYPAINRVTATLQTPWLHVAGNHDQDEDASDDAHATDTFRAAFGPTAMAWEEPQAVFIVLDDIVFQPGPKPSYIGGLREDQFAFLQAYLSTLSKDRLVVVGVHIPFFNVSPPGVPETFRSADRERLFALLKDFPHVLLLSAHTHNQRMEWHDASDGWHGAKPLREYNVGAACGAFWSGVKDADGIPASTMADGTPNGYASLRVQADGNYALAWHVARLPANDPSFTDVMQLEAPKVLRHGAYPAWAVYADVFIADAQQRVEYRIDSGAWKPMNHVIRPDPSLVIENVIDDQAEHLRGYDRSPEAKPSTHVWRGSLPTDLALREHTIEVRTFDPWQGEQRASTRYSLEDAPE